MIINTERTTLEFTEKYVFKTYNLDDEVNKLSSVENEIKSFEKFSMGGKNPYCPEVELLSKDRYKIKRYSFSLGGRKRIDEANTRRMLFTISYEEFDRQLTHIDNLLKETGIAHRDINPGNLLFSEEERKFKLIDFYWAKSDGINPGNPPNLNDKFSTDDSISFRMIKEEVKFIDEHVKKVVNNSLRFHLSEMGKMYLDGSAGAPGKAYHTIDIPYFRDIPKSNDGREEFNVLFKNLTFKPRKILDVGCAAGFNIFNMMRRLNLDLAIGFEADPHVYSFLHGCKILFNLKEFFVEKRITPSFEVPPVDVVLCMNVHMWLHKQFGKDGSDKIMNNLLNNCKELFFQTAGSESHGMYLVKELSSKEEIEKYLKSLNSKEVCFIRTTNAHGGFRHFFRVRGKLWFQ